MAWKNILKTDVEKNKKAILDFFEKDFEVVETGWKGSSWDIWHIYVKDGLELDGFYERKNFKYGLPWTNVAFKPLEVQLYGNELSAWIPIEFDINITEMKEVELLTLEDAEKVKRMYLEQYDKAMKRFNEGK